MQSTAARTDNPSVRSIAAALVCIACVGLGLVLGRPQTGTAPLVAALTVGAAMLFAGLVAHARARPRTDAHTRTSTVIVVTVAGLAGLLRGATVEPGSGSGELAHLERGSRATALREFEVVGASEPGPRCRLILRDPERARRSRLLRVSASPDVCPKSHGQRVALATRALRGDWPDPFTRTETIDLGRGPAVWPRPDAAGQTARRRYWHWVAEQRQRAWDLTRGRDAASLAVAVGVGSRSALDPRRRRQLRAAGLGHLIAVSGLHVAVAAVWLQALARRVAGVVGGTPHLGLALTWLPLIAYVGLTGAPASAVRAAAMLVGLDLATAVGRPAHGPTLLATTAAGMLLVRPGWAIDPGFQLSLAAMAAIVSAPRSIGPLASSWRISWVTAPLSALHFGSAPLHGLVANALALPLFALLMPTALLGSLSLGWLGVGALRPAEVFAQAILDLSAALAKVPAVGPAALVGIAVAFFCAHIALRDRHGLQRPEGPPEWIEHWLPSKVSCAFALALGGLLVAEPHGSLASSANERERLAVSFDWMAAGTVHSRTLVIADPAQPDAACLFRPTASTSAWAAVLGAFEIDVLHHVDAALPSSKPSAHDPEDPRRLELIAGLRARGFAVHSSDDPDACGRAPEPARVREALRACRYRRGGHGRVLAVVADDRLRCLHEGRWVDP